MAPTVVIDVLKKAESSKLERSLIGEPVRAGIRNARAKGKTLESASGNYRVLAQRLAQNLSLQVSGMMSLPNVSSCV